MLAIHLTRYIAKPDKSWKSSKLFEKNATVTFADNQGAIKLAQNSIFRSVRSTLQSSIYTRDLVQEGEIELGYKSTKETIADGWTESLGAMDFEKLQRTEA